VSPTTQSIEIALRAAGEPTGQVEVQLGHLCNNRCVFCVSGQLSEWKHAPQIDGEPVRAELRRAYEGGARKVTFLGGEPTIQRSFLDDLACAIALGFDEIVIFTNGVMTPREPFMRRLDAVVEPFERRGGKLTFRFSIQGGDADAHDRTTQNPGAFDRVTRSMALLAARGADMTTNLCVVSSNVESLSGLVDLCRRFGLRQAHLDLVRPADAGQRDDVYLRELMPTLTTMARAFDAMLARFDAELGPDFDINIGNLPYCVLPRWAHKIHHDGEQTWTVSADGRGGVQQAFDKYSVKRADKEKPARCGSCVLDARCSGVFSKYVAFHGDGELAPLGWAELGRHGFDAGTFGLDRAAHRSDEAGQREGLRRARARVATLVRRFSREGALGPFRVGAVTPRADGGVDLRCREGRRQGHDVVLGLVPQGTGQVSLDASFGQGDDGVRDRFSRALSDVLSRSREATAGGLRGSGQP